MHAKNRCFTLNVIHFYTAIRSPRILYPVIVWNVVSANKSRKHGWIWMKLGRWGWGLKRLSLARFQRNRTMGFGQSVKKCVTEALFFYHVNHAPTPPVSLDRFSPNFPRTRVQVVARDTRFHIPEKFPLRDRISRKTGRGKCSATPRLFPSPGGHPTDLSFVGDFCWGMYRFPAIHIRTSSFATISATVKPGCLYFFKHTRQGVPWSDRRFALIHYPSAHFPVSY